MPTEALALPPRPAQIREKHLTYRATPWPYVDAMRAMILSVMAYTNSTEQEARFILAKHMGFSITTLGRILDGRVADLSDTSSQRRYGWPKDRYVVSKIASGFFATGAFFPGQTSASLLRRLGGTPEPALDLDEPQTLGKVLAPLFRHREPGVAPTAYIPTAALPTPAQVEASGEALDNPPLAHGTYYLFNLDASFMAPIREARDSAPSMIKSQFSPAATPLLVLLQPHRRAQLVFPFLPGEPRTFGLRVEQVEAARLSAIPVDPMIVIKALHTALEARAAGVAAMVAPTTTRVTQEAINDLRILQTVVDDMGTTQEIAALVCRIKLIRAKLAS